MHVHFVIHMEFELPGAIQTWAASRGHSMTFSRVFADEPLPRERAIEGIDMLVVMGGPQAPSTTKAEYPFFDSPAEQELMAQCVRAGKKVLGVCLGAQLLGEALGGKTEGSPHKEIGCFPISLTEAGRVDPMVAHFGEKLTVAHWHGDMVGLPEGAVVLAGSEGCPRQIVRFAPNAYGLQCHMEFTRDLVGLMTDADENELREGADLPFVQSAEELHAYDYSEMNAALEGFLDRFAAANGAEELL
ncbi:glutamine amidotransferase-related protein [Corynebacterium heidelbergense]|uniref:Glutamine amidotransferase n=1 Tax=Corynebacterium heidelbergense TaxID=2055947 RepID=A0A364V3V5_9CORY|nr:gamma-glutamyl-gamma-aminobutyrate hydrolase family protein [Corynebacterium heidelbergense]RAV31313.1 glutamine amidotransferase [Corynebacterium heidelbergense]